MDRKELTRQYKETSRPMGVYRVLNTASGKALVGASSDVQAMLNRQRAQLRLRGHRNHALQADWDALGEAAFTFEVLDTIEPPEGKPDYDPADDLRVLEAMWLDRLSPFDGKGYNARPRPGR